jgi:hypothetical protein
MSQWNGILLIYVAKSIPKIRIETSINCLLLETLTRLFLFQDSLRERWFLIDLPLLYKPKA